MAEFFKELNDELMDFIKDQKIFFTATAPKTGRINLSPKGMDSFRCVDLNTVAYLDLTGSGNETAAHIFDDGRLTLMFCSFSRKPLILRLSGKGRVVLPRHEDWANWHSHFNSMVGERQIIVLNIDMVQSACGYGVPVYDFVEERDLLTKWTEKRGEQGLKDYWLEHGQKSLDGLDTHLLED